MRVARPTSTSSRPVANGSSVPAWPTRRPRCSRRTAATMSCDVLPAGLSMSRTPSDTGPRLRPGTCVGVQRAAPPRPRYPSSCAATSWRRNATSSSGAIAVAKPAAWRWPPPLWARAMSETSTSPSVARSETFDVPGAALAGQLARERGDLRALHRAQVVDDPLGVGLLGAGLGEVLARQARERQAAVVEALHAGSARASAARAWARACPRRGGGRSRARRRRPR